MKCNKEHHETAKQIADELFVNGIGQEAERLVLELPGGKDGGGWSKSSVIGRICQVLARQTESTT